MADDGAAEWVASWDPMRRQRDRATACVLECNEWLLAPESETSPQWLRDLVIATRDWVEDIREINATR
jgi:hypothetical protein